MLPATTATRDRDATAVGNWFGPGFGGLFEEAFGASPARRGWAPAADLWEAEDAFRLEMELPGFDRDDVELAVNDGTLTVRGRRPAGEAAEDATYLMRERADQQFSRSFRLPASVDAEAVDATLRNGVLHVTLPKTAEARPRKIEVSSA